MLGKLKSIVIFFFPFRQYSIDLKLKTFITNRPVVRIIFLFRKISFPIRPYRYLEWHTNLFNFHQTKQKQKVYWEKKNCTTRILRSEISSHFCSVLIECFWTKVKDFSFCRLLPLPKPNIKDNKHIKLLKERVNINREISTVF